MKWLLLLLIPLGLWLAYRLVWYVLDWMLDNWTMLK